MKAGWQTKTFGEVCKFVRGPFGGSLKKSIFVESGFAVYEQQHAIYNQFTDIRYFIDEVKFNEMRRFELSPGDLIMSCSGTMGKVAIVPDGIERGIINQALLKLSPSNTVAVDFLKYWMDSPSFQEGLQAQAGGAAIQNVASVGILKEIKILLPTIAEQQRIVAILDEAFDGIATAKANAERNLKNARELFESYLQSVFTQRGDGWMARRLGDVFEIGSSKRIMEKDWVSTGVPFYGGKEIVKLAKFGSVTSNAYISEEKYRDYASKYDMPKENDILITARGTIGVGYIVKKADKFYYKDGNIISMRAKAFANPYFMLYAFKSNVLLDQLDELTGTTVRHLPIEKAKELTLQVPEFETQNSVVRKIRKVEEETQRLESIYQQKITALDELKKSLLHKAFSGQL